MENPLSRRKKLMYGAGDIGFSLTSTILGVYFLFFMIEVVGLRPAVAAIPIGIGKIWDFINDPIFGYISDRTRTRWGRRRPYLLFGALPLAFTFTMLWYALVYFKTAPQIIGSSLINNYVWNMLDPLFIGVPLSFLLTYIFSKLVVQDKEEEKLVKKAFENI